MNEDRNSSINGGGEEKTEGEEKEQDKRQVTEAEPVGEMGSGKREGEGGVGVGGGRG